MMTAEVAEEGQAYIENDFLVFQPYTGWEKAEVDLNKLEYVYAEKWVNGVALLYLRDSHINRIPINCQGFNSVYEKLSNRFGFDDDTFIKVISNEDRQKKRIWRRKYDKNYKISQGTHSAKAGINVLGQLPAIIDWDMPYTDLLKTDLIQIQSYDDGRNFLSFKYPVQIETIILDNLYAQIDHLNPGSPIVEFYSRIRNEDGNDIPFHEIKSSLQKKMMLSDKAMGIQREDCSQLNYDDNNIRFTITYWYDSIVIDSYESNYTSLRITNLREYPDLYKNNDNPNISSPDLFIVINTRLWTSDKYRENENIKEKPKLIKELSGSNPCIWFNRDKDTIGFSGETFCQEFRNQDIQSIHLIKIYPQSIDRSYLELKLNNKQKKVSILSGGYMDFDEYIERIEAVVKRRLILENEYGGR